MPELRIDNVPLLGLPITLPAVPPPPDAEGGIDLDPFGHDGTDPGPSSSPVPESDPVTGAWLVIELQTRDRPAVGVRTLTSCPTLTTPPVPGRSAVRASKLSERIRLVTFPA